MGELGEVANTVGAVVCLRDFARKLAMAGVQTLQQILCRSCQRGHPKGQRSLSAPSCAPLATPCPDSGVAGGGTSILGGSK